MKFNLKFKHIFILGLGMAFNINQAHTSSVPIHSYEQDKQSIKSMIGCYEVTFQNAETFALIKDYQYRDRYQSKAIEWIFVDDEDIGKLSLQHLLITPVGVIKHWRQLWQYENRHFYHFDPPMTWNFLELPWEKVEGHWTQKVYQVDDSPRYECSAPWIHWGSKHYWECETKAPLPRREFTVRQDYNILKRNNRHEITSYGHVHDEDNTKILKKEGQEIPLAMEKGMNVYRKVDFKLCEKAIKWWPAHKTFWNDVQFVWEEIYAGEKNLTFHDKRDGKTLWEKLFELDEKLSTSPNYSSERTKEMVRSLIQGFIIP